MEFVVGLFILAVLVLGYEYRFRKPDHIIVRESRAGFSERKTSLYPRHFSLAIPRTPHVIQLTVGATAKGNLELRVRLAASVVAATEHLSALVRMGGWSQDAVPNAAKELEGRLQSFVREYAERYTIEELSSQKVLDYLHEQIPACTEQLGIETVSLTILSFEPGDSRIAEALRQQEHARILEQTETLQQKARIATAKTKLKADEEIALLENELEMKKFEMKKRQVEQESILADQRVDEELRRDRKRLLFDKEELEVLKSNPELLMLTPQAARLAEASQGLKNARTIVALSPQELMQGSELLGAFQRLLQNALETAGKEKPSKQK